MKFKQRTLESLGDLVCGNTEFEGEARFEYRSSSKLTRFFQDLDTEWRHNGETRRYWVAGVIEAIMAETGSSGDPPELFSKLIDQLMDPHDAVNESRERPLALAELNLVLEREGLEAFYGTDGHCYLRNIDSGRELRPQPNPHRPMSAEELRRRDALLAFLESCSEDDLIEQVLLPLFRQLGFHRITAAGHKDKALEYGKDVWMRFTLPTQNRLYFGLQAKKGKIDSSGQTKAGNANVAELLNQALMMLAHEVFDPEINRRVLVDHAFIVSGGEITKAARNWIGNALDASKRSQIMFLDRDDILNLFVVSGVPLPDAALADSVQVPPDPWSTPF